MDLAAGQSDTEPPQRVDLADIAEEVVGLASRRTGRQIVLRASGDTTTDGRPGMLQRAMSNLVENAAKSDRAGQAPIEGHIMGPARPGTVRVEVHHDDNPWIINGLAVAPRRVIMTEGASNHTLDRLAARGVEVITLPYDLMCSGGGGPHCSTSPLIRDAV